jgi:hypothetical protein
MYTAVRTVRVRGGRNKFGPLYRRDRAIKALTKLQSERELLASIENGVDADSSDDDQLPENTNEESASTPSETKTLESSSSQSQILSVESSVVPDSGIVCALFEPSDTNSSFSPFHLEGTDVDFCTISSNSLISLHVPPKTEEPLPGVASSGTQSTFNASNKQLPTLGYQDSTSQTSMFDAISVPSPPVGSLSSGIQVVGQHLLSNCGQCYNTPNTSSSSSQHSLSSEQIYAQIASTAVVLYGGMMTLGPNCSQLAIGSSDSTSGQCVNPAKYPELLSFLTQTDQFNDEDIDIGLTNVFSEAMARYQYLGVDYGDIVVTIARLPQNVINWMLLTLLERGTILTVQWARNAHLFRDLKVGGLYFAFSFVYSWQLVVN